MKRGQFITVEGIEGVGKSTQLALLRGFLEQRGFKIEQTREPGGTPAAERIRHALLHGKDEAITPQAELLMVFAARAQHLAHRIEPALARGEWVLCDRFTDATLAYQGAGRGLDRSRILELADWVHPTTWPDLTLLIDLPLSVGRERVEQRGTPDRFEAEQNEFFERVRAAYLEGARQAPARIRVVNGAGSVESVHREIVRVVTEWLDNLPEEQVTSNCD